MNLAKALEEGALDQDPFIKEYRAKRLEEMKQQAKMGAKRCVCVCVCVCTCVVSVCVSQCMCVHALRV